MSIKRLLFASFFSIALLAPLARASTLFFVSDLINDSRPGVTANHRIQFTVVNAVPASGSIVLTPEGGAFVIPGGFDFTDVDFAVWNGSAYVDRTLANAPSAGADGVAVLSGGSGSITLKLSSSQGLSAGDKVQITLGTSTSFQSTGTEAITNPVSPGSYHIYIETRSPGNGLIDNLSAVIAVILPITTGIPLPNVPPILSNGFPAGTIAAGNSTIELSFQTDKVATCRYATTTNVTYTNMTADFSTFDNFTFYTVLSGFQDGTSYNFYVRCKGQQGAMNDTDFPISFTLEPTPVSDTSVTPPTGVIGTGPFPNGSPVLYLAGVAFAGFTAPGSTVTILTDGSQSITTQAHSDGTFAGTVSGLERGTYTFAIYATDSTGHRSSSYSATLSLNAGTNNSLTGIVLPPTIALDNDSVQPSDPVRIFGATAPNSSVDVTLTQQSDSGGASNAQTATATTTDGSWEVNFPPRALAIGIYAIRARATHLSSQSDSSARVLLGVGKSLASSTVSNAAGSDLNGDGKINLIDFSILLTSWGTSNPDADLNHDGTVNLADFSILLFNWTG